ncbi:hypothetical protein AOLI_G00230720 [Acnodon oligacanthus]
MQMSGLHVSIRELHMALVNMNYGPILEQDAALCRKTANAPTSTPAAGSVLRKAKQSPFLCLTFLIYPVHGACFLGVRFLGVFLWKNKATRPELKVISTRGTPLEKRDSSGTVARGFQSEDLGRVHLSCFHFIRLRHPSPFSIFTFLSP